MSNGVNRLVMMMATAVLQVLLCLCPLVLVLFLFIASRIVCIAREGEIPFQQPLLSLSGVLTNYSSRHGHHQRQEGAETMG